MRHINDYPPVLPGDFGRLKKRRKEMDNYKKYISMGISLILIPLAKRAISKLVNKQTKKLTQNGAIAAVARIKDGV